MNWYGVVSALSAVGGVLISALGFMLALAKKLSAEERELGTMITQLSDIREGIKTLQILTDRQERSLSAMESRLSRMEESVLQTQNRMDRFDSRTSHGHDSAVS